MTSDKSLFQELDGNNSGNVTFNDNSREVIQGIDTIGNTSQTLIKHELYGEDFVHNLLSISQLHENGFKKNALMLMHVISLIQVPTKSHILEKGMTMCMLFILMKLTFIMNHACA